VWADREEDLFDWWGKKKIYLIGGDAVIGLWIAVMERNARIHGVAQNTSTNLN